MNEQQAETRCHRNAEEDHLREMLADLQRRHQATTAPIIRRLAEIESRKPIVMVIDLKDVDPAVLAGIRKRILPDAPVA